MTMRYINLYYITLHITLLYVVLNAADSVSHQLLAA